MTSTKRFLDISASLFGLFILSPLFAVVAAIVKCSDGGTVFFAQERIGYRSRPFRILKFRTMRMERSAGDKLITVGEDPRITRIGRVLRKLKVDELPQLINVLNGEMSLVGPRPEVPFYVAKYTAEQRRVLDLVPGITDPASIRFRNESDVLALSSDPETTYVDEIMPEKIRLNLEYGRSASLKSDLSILFKTLFVLAPFRRTA